MVTEKLADRYPEKFVDYILAKHPAPKGPDAIDMLTGELIPGQALWESGIRLQGNQRACICDPWRFKQAGGGIRGGKSFIGGLACYLDYVWRRYERGITDDLWGVIGDTYDMAQEEMRHLDRLLTEAGMLHTFSIPEGRPWSITFPDSKCEIRTLTASDVSKLASRPYRGIVIAEAAQTVERAWIAASERVSQTRGWVLMEGTFESQKGPWYSLKAIDWMKAGAEGVYYSLPSWENLVIYPGGREDPEIVAREANMSPELFMERYGGVPSKRSGLVMQYAEAKYQVLRKFPHQGTSFDPDIPVMLWSDPGINHAYANFAVQGYGSTCWIIDAVYRWGRSAQEVIEECAGRAWAPNVHIAVMDFAARQRRVEGPPVVQQWAEGWHRATGQSISILTQPVPLQVGYDWHKRALLNTWPETVANERFNRDNRLRKVVDPEGPRLFIDPDAAAPLFGGYVDGQMYAGEYNLHQQKKNREGTILHDDPDDTNNDGIKAINYGGFWYWGAGGYQWKVFESGTSAAWELSVA